MPYRYVKNIDIKIYNRWGVVMFSTEDADILWDGKNMSNKKPCPDGTYFYLCTVNEIRVDGIIPHTLKGFIQLINDKSPTQ
jgi:gliding motility-associated-like protein